MRIYTETALLFVRPPSVSSGRRDFSQQVTVRTRAKDFCEVPEWVGATPMFKSGVSAGIISVLSSDSNTMQQDGSKFDQAAVGRRTRRPRKEPLTATEENLEEGTEDAGIDFQIS